MRKPDVEKVLLDKGFKPHNQLDNENEVWVKGGYWYQLGPIHLIMTKPAIGMVSFSYEHMKPSELEKVLLP